MFENNSQLLYFKIGKLEGSGMMINGFILLQT